MKAKTINDKKLNGEMYISMLSSYVSAINDGAVPNIENAWNYMCREQSSRLMHESLELFEFKMKDIKMPVNQEIFSAQSDRAVEVALEYYREKLIGDDVP